MDAMAVVEASEQDLMELGLKKRGDLISLKAHASQLLKRKNGNDERQEKKRALLAICEGGSTKRTKKNKKDKSDTERKRSIQCGWMHYDNKRGRFIPVRLDKGGGTRNLSISTETKVSNLLPQMTSIFFPDGMSVYGNISDMIIDIGNFKGDIMTASEQNISEYIEKNSLTRVRLYILTKHYLEIDSDDSETDLESAFLDCKQSDCIDKISPLSATLSNAAGSVTTSCTATVIESLQSSHSPTSTCTSTMPLESLAYLPSSNYVLSNNDFDVDNLIGTSSERYELIEEQDREFRESLEADRLKEQTKRRQESLKAARTMRVVPIPSPEEPQVKISIRHITLGIVTRPFAIDNYVSAIYDWVGSLSLTPEHFVLKMHNTEEVSPLQPVISFDKMVLNMSEALESPEFPDQDVCFLGYGSTNPSSSTNPSQNDDTSEDGDILRY